MKQWRPSQIAASLCIVAITLLISACDSPLGERATATRKLPYGATVVTKGPSLPTPTLIPTPRPTAAVVVQPPATAQPDPSTLTAQAEMLCRSAKPAQKTIASLPKGTLQELSIMVMSAHVWEQQPKWQSFNMPFVSAVHASAVQHLICIRADRTKSGTYKGGASGATGWILNWNVTMLKYPSGNSVASAHLKGDNPPQTALTTKDTKDIYGMPPMDALRQVLLGLSGGKSVLADGYPIDDVVFTPDGEILLTCSFNIGGTTKAWDTATRREPRTLMQNGTDKCLTFSADGKMLATADMSNSDRDAIRFWDTSGDKARNLIEKTMPQIQSAAISPDGKIAAVGSGARSTSRITLLDTSTWQEIITINNAGTLVSSLSFSPDGKTIAAGLFKDTVVIYDVATGKQLRAMDGIAMHSLNDVSFSPDGKLLAAADIRNVKIWDAQTGVNTLTLGMSARSLAFSPDGTMLALGDSQGNVKLWDVTKGVYLRTLRGHAGDVTALAFSADGTKLATGSWDTTAAVWDVTEK